MCSVEKDWKTIYDGGQPSICETKNAILNVLVDLDKRVKELENGPNPNQDS